MSSFGGKAGAQGKIESPMARYTPSGDLMCVLCSKTIKPPSEKLWAAHLISGKHKERVAQLKSSLAKPSLPEKTDKKSSSTNVPAPLPPKPLKGILVNKRKSIAVTDIPISQVSTGSVTVPNDSASSIPSKVPKIETENPEVDSQENTNVEMSESPAKAVNPEGEGPLPGELPKGFFDDPKMDARARNVEFVDPMEKEFQEFQKVIQQEEFQSENMQIEETTLRLHEREIEQIEGQMSYFARAAALFNQSASGGQVPKQDLSDLDTQDIISHFLSAQDEKEKVDLKASADDVQMKLINGFRENLDSSDSIYSKNFIKSEPENESDEEDDDLSEFDMSNWRKKSLLLKQ